MKAKWIPICLVTFILASCASYEQNNEPAPFPYNPKSSSPCRAIKQQLNPIVAPQIPANSVYPPQYGATPTAIQKARLLREYEYYGCTG